MIRVEAVLVNAVMPDSILVSIVGIGRGVGVVGGGTCGDDGYAVDGDDSGDDKDNDDNDEYGLDVGLRLLEEEPRVMMIMLLLLMLTGNITMIVMVRINKES